MLIIFLFIKKLRFFVCFRGPWLNAKVWENAATWKAHFHLILLTINFFFRYNVRMGDHLNSWVSQHRIDYQFYTLCLVTCYIGLVTCYLWKVTCYLWMGSSIGWSRINELFSNLFLFAKLIQEFLVLVFYLFDALL